MAIATRSPEDVSSAATAEDLAAVGAALADPTRVRMLRLMQANDEVACAALEATFSLTKSTISYHVRVLRHAGLIRVRKTGKFYHYALMRDEIERHFPGLLALLAATEPPQVANVESAETEADCDPDTSAP
ncbi:MAG TPA: metalloregulator ArsR/SmtB family transcription factor [Ktedonobacterales bacterium]|nr:metalloregulator ArsR/SmtB family transcription factor [Ktedonobacterales bacterium]HEX5159066.1 metalloregulator ArsR/SmtB family transcription factor [Ktedonobacterales bacterium]